MKILGTVVKWVEDHVTGENPVILISVWTSNYTDYTLKSKEEREGVR
jgi:hypothetical protein